MSRYQMLFVGLVAAVMSSGLVACDSNSSSNQSGNQPGTAGGAASQNFSVPCPNPISLDHTGMPLAQPGNVWGNRRFEVVELQVYDVIGTTNSSFSADAKKDENFRVNIGCQQVASTEDMDGSVSSASWIDGASKQHSNDSQSLSVSFVDGQLSTASVSAEASPVGDGSLGDDTTSVDHQAVTGNNGDVEYVSYRVYKPSQDEVELRFKFESNNGAPLTEFGRVVYRVRE